MKLYEIIYIYKTQPVHPSVYICVYIYIYLHNVIVLLKSDSTFPKVGSIFNNVDKKW